MNFASSIAAEVFALGKSAGTVEAAKEKTLIDMITFDESEPFRYGQKGLIIQSIQHKLQDYDLQVAQEETREFYGVKTRCYSKIPKTKETSC
ncbi:hypothetical protein KHA80_20960 [Anaerobacillus sp. HL2]|nr:hypothetical protein KHA80_20960 [Anaerobacillus sp. HL2]